MKPCLVVVSKQHSLFASIEKALLASYAGPVERFALFDSAKEAELKRRLARGNLQGAIALGRRACEILSELAPEDMPCVCCSYEPLAFERPRSLCLRLKLTNDLTAHLPVIKTLTPQCSKVAVLCRGLSSSGQLELPFALDAQVEIKSFPIEDWKEFPLVVERALIWSDAVWLPLDTSLMKAQTLQYVLQKALLMKKPIYTFSSRIVRGGALASLVPDPKAVGKRAAEWISSDGQKRVSGGIVEGDQILWINRKVARFLKLDAISEPLPYRTEELN